MVIVEVVLFFQILWQITTALVVEAHRSFFMRVDDRGNIMIAATFRGYGDRSPGDFDDRPCCVFAVLDFVVASESGCPRTPVWREDNKAVVASFQVIFDLIYGEIIPTIAAE